jgi:drug/metabolite transporter (DMT)-like permease
VSPAIVLAAALAILIWGGSAVAGRIAVMEMPPLAVAALRTVPAGAALLPLVLVLRIALPRDRERLFLLALSAACGFVAFPMLFSIGVAHTNATHAAMILAIAPLLTGAMAQAWDRRAPPARWWLGGAIALVGEAVLVLGRADVATLPGANPALGDAVVAMAAVVGSLGYVAGGRLNRLGYPAQATTYWGVILGSAALVPLLPWMLAGTDWGGIGPWGIGSLIYIAVGVTVVGYVLWYWALGHGGIARIGMFQFAQPIVSVVLAGLILSEPLGPTVAIAGALVIAGVWIATRPA